MEQERDYAFPHCIQELVLLDRMLYYKNYVMTSLKLLPTGNLSAKNSLCNKVLLLFGIWVLLPVCALCFLALVCSRFAAGLEYLVRTAASVFPFLVAFSLLVTVQ